MNLSPFYTMIVAGVFIVLAIWFCVRLYRRFMHQELIYKEIMAQQNEFLCLVSDKLICQRIYQTAESDYFRQLFSVGSDLLHIVMPENREMLQLMVKRAFEQNSPQTLIVQLNHLEKRIWCQLNLNPITLNDDKIVLLVALKNITEIMRLRHVEKELHIQESMLPRISFDVFWKLDVETRRVTLLNDISFERHGMFSCPRGEYEIRDLVFPLDCAMLEDELAFRIRKFLSEGEDPYANALRIMNVRMRSPRALGVWAAVTGFLTRSEDGRLLMYGSMHKIETPSFANSSPIDNKNIFSTIMRSSVLRVFWCDTFGTILGGNTNFATSMNVPSIDNLCGKSLIEDIHGARGVFLRYMYSHLKELSNHSAKTQVYKEFNVYRSDLDTSCKGEFELLTLRKTSGEIEGGLFIYSFHIEAENSALDSMIF